MNLSAMSKSAVSILLIVVCLFVGGCEKEPTILNTANLIGTWQLVQADSDLTDGNTPDRIEGYKLTFNADSTFTSEKYGNCNQGRFSVTGGEYLLLEYDCPDKESLLGLGNQIEKFGLKRGYLYLTPTYINCIEGCYYKFVKISD